MVPAEALLAAVVASAAWLPPDAAAPVASYNAVAATGTVENDKAANILIASAAGTVLLAAATVEIVLDSNKKWR